MATARRSKSHDQIAALIEKIDIPQVLNNKTSFSKDRQKRNVYVTINVRLTHNGLVENATLKSTTSTSNMMKS